MTKTEDAVFVVAGVITVLSGSGATLGDVDASEGAAASSRIRKCIRQHYPRLPTPRSSLRQKSPLGTPFLPETGGEDRAHSWPGEIQM